MKTLRQRVKELENENKKLWEYLSLVEFKLENVLRSIEKTDSIGERIEIINQIQKGKTKRRTP